MQLTCGMKHTERKTMTTWNSFKKEIDSISQAKMSLLDQLALLHAERIMQGISQAELAKRIGMTQLQLAKIENLDLMPSVKILSQYARGLRSKH